MDNTYDKFNDPSVCITYDKNDADDQFVKNKIEFINKYKLSSNTANSTIDDNSNVANKNLAILNAEIHKPDNIRISRAMVMNKLKELYPDFNSKRYVRDLEDHVIYKHDESSFGAIAPYCVSVTMYPFLMDGIKGLGGLSASPKNLKSFCGIFCNMIFAISSQFAGAVAVSEALLYFTYFCKKEWGDDFYKRADEIIERPKNSEPRTILKEIQQYWQQIIYTINQPAAARGFQSAFVNFSYFDRTFFEGMFGDFYFPDGTKPDWESLKWIQMEFMKWFNAERLKTILTFPVETVTLLYKDGKFEDEEMFKFVCDEYSRGHSFFTYISDTVDSLSSCCFKGDELIKVYDKGGNSKLLSIAEFVNMNDSSINEFGNKILKDDYYIYSYTIKGVPEKVKITGTLKKEYNGKLLKLLTDSSSITVTEDHLVIVRDYDLKDNIVIRADHVKANKHYLMTSFGSTVQYKKVISVEEIDYSGIVYDIELDKNHYFSSNDIITHNCRLKNKLQTKEFNFTNGNIGVMTGSKSVITFNLSRLIQLWYRKECEKKDVESFEFDETYYSSLKKYLTKLTDRVYKYHHAYNELLWDMYDANLLPAYRAGFIDLNKQYLTLGLNGLNQAAEFLGMKCNVNDKYARFCQEIFSFFKEQNELHKDKTSKHHLIFNTEQVPAESLASKNYQWDKKDGFWVPEDTNLYASYVFKPNDNLVSVLDKIKMHGKDYIGDFLDGGAALHANLDSHLSSIQYEHLLEYAASVGCNYLTFNVPNAECQDCGFIAKQPFDKCPKCGSAHVDLYDRIIGYLTKIKNWSNCRQKEFETRVFNHLDDNDCDEKTAEYVKYKNFKSPISNKSK